jgi:hypothetical protein
MAKKTKPLPEGIFNTIFFQTFHFSSSVICLSDDDGEEHKITTPLITPVKQQSVTIIDSNNKIDKSQPSDWNVQRKDIIRVPDLAIKHSDLIKKTLEMNCSAVRFGIIEFNVESEIILLKDIEFEFKLRGK